MNAHLISKRLQSHAKAASIALWASLAISVLFHVQEAVLTYIAVSASGVLKEPVFGSMSDEDLVTLGSSWLMFAIYFVTMVTFFVWFEYSYRNLPMLTDSSSHHPRWMAVLGWIIPFIAFFVPYQMTKEIWRKLSEHRGVSTEIILDSRRSKFLLPVWWGFHLASVYVLPVVALVLALFYSLERDWVGFSIGLALGVPSYVTVLLEIQVIRSTTALYLPLLQAVADSQSGACIAPPPKPAMSS